MDLWWSRAERIAWELEKLDEAGFRYDPPGEIPDTGTFELTVYAEIDGEEHALRVLFPDFYPFFRFQVKAPTLDLSYHQNPFGKDLCLLGRASEKWLPSDSLVRHLQERLPRLVESAGAESAEEAADLEEHQAEPFSEYYPCVPGAMILIDGSWEIPDDVDRGELIIGYKQGARFVIQGAVLKVLDDSGKRLCELASAVAQNYPERVKGRWLRFPEPLKSDKPSSFLRELTRIDSRPDPRWRTVPGGKQVICAALFSEEVGWRDKSGTGWVFVMGAREKRGDHLENPRHAFVKAGRAGEQDLSQRIPELSRLSEETVAVFGLGCIGAPSALEFARAGVGGLHLLDRDFVDPGTAVRWPLGFATAGLNKSDVLESFIKTHYPYTSVKHALVHRFGSPYDGSDGEALEKMLDGASLLYDATTELGVQRFLSLCARREGIPYVGVYGTYGGWGGVVVRIRPGKTAGCWWCFQEHLEDGLIPEPPGEKPADESEWLQPEGCGDPTFTGANFDLGTVAIAGVRAAVEVMAGGRYPETEWDVLVISLRDDSGEASLPRFEGFPLPRHPECPDCRT